MNAKTIIDEMLSTGLTQKEIERRWGIKQSTISHLHRGSRGKRTSHELMGTLIAALNELRAESVTA